MKRIKLLFISILLVLSGIYFSGCTKDSAQEHKHAEETKADLYYCPMHPQVTSDKPGVCPICHMDLVKKADNQQMSASEMEGMLTLNERGLVLANVSTTKVTRENIAKQVNAFGYLEFAEPNRKLITARFNGRIEKLFVDATGRYIQKGQALFEIYSPDIVQAQNEYLIALKNTKGVKYASLNNPDVNSNNALLNSARKKLQLFGITEKQISELEQTGEVQLTSTYYSPYSGTVIEKKVQEGMYVNEGTVIYDVADLSTLWNIAEIFSDDIGMIKNGDRVQISTQAYPGEVFNGRVTFIYPVVNSESRTLKIRMELSNPGGKLKPQMYTESIFEKNYGQGLTVPDEAVLFTGKRTIVWVRVGEHDKTSGMFEARDVRLGVKSNGKYQIVTGLKEGEDIATTGGFLIDSESQLQSGNAPVHQHGEEQSKPSEKSREMKDSDFHENHKSEVTPQKTDEHKNHKMESNSSIVREGDIDVKAIDSNKDGKVYQCPMDWNVIADKPGSCPLCKMDLEEVSIKKAKQNLIDNGFKTK